MIRKGFSILIPTWNNLGFLQLCLKSLRQHSVLDHEIMVLINDGSDGTKEWVEAQQGLKYIHFNGNVGICVAMNKGAAYATHEYILYLNDDMYVLPGWDTALRDELDSIGHNDFFISSTMIEPTDTGNPCVIVKDYGNELTNFQEEKLLKEFNALQKEDWNGSTWPPNLLHMDLWKKVGGLSEEFSPGMYSDPDLSMKLWQAGVRHFKGVSKSRVYHFGTRSTSRIKHNDGKKRFLQKWGITPGDFAKHYLHRGTKFTGPLPEANRNAMLKLKAMIKKISK
jgi:glycosyltransferase involved in cell wall biosynthesis